MDRDTEVRALLAERDSLVHSPDRPAKDRRIDEVDGQLRLRGHRVEDAADHTPLERAVPTRGARK